MRPVLTHQDLVHLYAGYPRKAVRKAPSDDDARVHRLVLLGGAAVAGLAKRYDDGSLTKEQFIDQAVAALKSHGQTAAALGAAQFGGASDHTAIDDYAEAQADYLDGFADDIDSGGADGEGISVAAIAVRAAMYGGVIWTAYQMGKTDGAPEDTSWAWVLDPDAAHCDDPNGLDCPTLSESGPWVMGDLPALPGDGTTPCLSRCRCNLEAM